MRQIPALAPTPTPAPAIIIDKINPTDHPPDDICENNIPLFSFPNEPVTGNEIIEAAKLLQTKKTLNINGRKDLMDNYRPISLLSCFSQIFEKIVCAWLTAFLDVNNLISDAQFGFRKKHSTLHRLIQFLNFISTALDKN